MRKNHLETPIKITGYMSNSVVKILKNDKKAMNYLVTEIMQRFDNAQWGNVGRGIRYANNIALRRNEGIIYAGYRYGDENIFVRFDIDSKYLEIYNSKEIFNNL